MPRDEQPFYAPLQTSTYSVGIKLGDYFLILYIDHLGFLLVFLTLFQQPTATSAQVGYANTATYGAPAATALQSAQQQQVAWSQQAAAQGAQQADAQQGVYGRTSAGVTSVPSSGGSANAANQYGGQYGAVYAGQQGASQQVRLISADTSVANGKLEDISSSKVVNLFS